MIEIFCLEPYEESNEFSVVMAAKEKVKWKCMIGGAGKWKEGTLIKECDNRKQEYTIEAKIDRKTS